MKLVVTMGIRQLPSQPRPLQDLYREHLEEAALAEEPGFDNVWASEHHFSPDAWNPSPITFLAAVAAGSARRREQCAPGPLPRAPIPARWFAVGQRTRRPPLRIPVSGGSRLPTGHSRR